MAELDAQNRVPKELQPFLPSSSVENLDATKDKYYIIESLLHNADFIAWRWMLKTYSLDIIEEIVRSSNNLAERDLRIWQHYLSIPENEIKCLQKKSLQMRKKHWIA